MPQALDGASPGHTSTAGAGHTSYASHTSHTPRAPARTALLYDERMLLHREEEEAEGQAAAASAAAAAGTQLVEEDVDFGHPERPGRIAAVWRRLTSQGGRWEGRLVTVTSHHVAALNVLLLG